MPIRALTVYRDVSILRKNIKFRKVVHYGKGRRETRGQCSRTSDLLLTHLLKNKMIYLFVFAVAP